MSNEVVQWKWLVIHSAILNEEFIFMRDKQWLAEARIAHPDKAVYFPQEIDQLDVMADPVTLGVVHNLKKRMMGWVVDRRPMDAPEPTP